MSQVPLIEIDNLHAKASISLFGGQVLAFCPHRDGRERLFMASAAKLDGSTAIRGGIPVCWPWFGSREEAGLPAHGWLRTRMWQLIERSDDIDATRLVLRPEHTEGPGFAGSAEVELHISVGMELQLDLLTRNTGRTPFALTCALHSYFAVPDIEAVQLTGLKGPYRDKNRNWGEFDTPQPYRFSEATDRVHLDRPARVHIEFPGTMTSIASTGHDSIVVWNPWTACAEQFSDMAAEDYRRMLCVETAVTTPLLLQPGSMHLLSQGVR